MISTDHGDERSHGGRLNRAVSMYEYDARVITAQDLTRVADDRGQRLLTVVEEPLNAPITRAVTHPKCSRPPYRRCKERPSSVQPAAPQLLRAEHARTKATDNGPRLHCARAGLPTSVPLPTGRKPR
jgi:hypothetical protein